MGSLHFTKRAREDLLEIWLYIARQTSETAADQVYDRIGASCRQLRDHPMLGPSRPQIADDARILIAERWLVLYRLLDDGVQVVRIVDGARDLTKIEWVPADDSPGDQNS